MKKSLIQLHLAVLLWGFTGVLGKAITLSAPAGAERYIWSNGDSVQSITVGAAGTFTLRTVTAGCTSLVSAPLTTTVTTCSGNLTLTSPNGAITDGPGNYSNNNKKLYFACLIRKKRFVFLWD
jgi:hypothetical protein